MLAALGHDFRSPLTAMGLRAEMLEESEDSARLNAPLDEMQRMVETTLEFARGVARAKPAARSTSPNWSRGCSRTRVAGEKRRSTPDRAGLGAVRPTALRRALRNLIDNAVRYGDRAHVSSAARPEGDRHDRRRGPGLPQDNSSKVFEPFVRLEGSRSRETGGVGLGLASRGPCSAQGGEILRILPRADWRPRCSFLLSCRDRRAPLEGAAMLVRPPRESCVG